MLMRKKRYFSMFAKSVLAFAMIGIVPMLVMGFSIYREYSSKVTESILINAAQISNNTAKSINDLLEESDECTRYLYQYGISEYDYFYQLISDTDITETKKELLINDILRTLLYRNEYNCHVYFVTPNKTIYSEKKAARAQKDYVEIKSFHEKYFQEDERSAYLIHPHQTAGQPDSNSVVITVARNIYNTKTIDKTPRSVLGTIYIDLEIRFLDELVKMTQKNIEQDFYLINKPDGSILYGKDNYLLNQSHTEYVKWKDKFSKQSGMVETPNQYLIYNSIKGTDWILLSDISKNSINTPYQQIQRNTVLLIFMAGLLLGVIYIFYAVKTNQPMKELMNTMFLIQKGDLTARARISTHDEIAVIADGLNEMTKQLKSHINQVYVAQINQRDAQLDALRMQIQPHYLYNTLDVIRMSAMTNHDFTTAEMLNSLSKQLKYAISTTKDMVPLRVEADSIINYFKLVEIRFENKYELEVHIPEELMEYAIPKMILQPSIENAIKHGLRQREGRGKIEVTAERCENRIIITIMDNGVGMSDEKLEEIQKLLHSKEPGKRTDENWESIGIKNVNDRIRIMYGEEYFLTMDSVKGIGTIVKYILPLKETKEC